LVKAILDGCNGVAFDDDARVVDLSVSKRYADTPRVEVTVMALPMDSAT
jgi:Holliday junction resolvase RusA-like endonuclease